MNKIYKTILFAFCLLALKPLIAQTTHIITVQGTSFSPSVLAVEVGDSVIWQWVSGFHTTTSTSVPVGAASWDHPLTTAGDMYGYKVTVAGSYLYQCDVHGPNMSGRLDATNPNGIQSPLLHTEFLISLIRPSVYNFSFALNKNSFVKFTMFDLTGKLVRILQAEELKAGDYDRTFYFNDLQSGIYIVEMLAGNQRITKRIIVE